jgi:anti-anti-sigma factor
MSTRPPDLSPGGAWRPLRCPVRHERDALRIAPEGELDLESASVLRSVLDEHLEAGCPRLVLDLRGVTFIDSTGLRAVIEADRSAGARGVDLTVLPGPPQVQRIFEVTGTGDIFSVG